MSMILQEVTYKGKNLQKILLFLSFSRSLLQERDVVPVVRAFVHGTRLYQ